MSSAARAATQCASYSLALLTVVWWWPCLKTAALSPLFQVMGLRPRFMAVAEQARIVAGGGEPPANEFDDDEETAKGMARLFAEAGEAHAHSVTSGMVLACRSPAWACIWQRRWALQIPVTTMLLGQHPLQPPNNCNLVCHTSIWCLHRAVRVRPGVGDTRGGNISERHLSICVTF